MEEDEQRQSSVFETEQIEPDATEPSALPPAPTPPPARPRRRLLPWILAGIAFVAAVGLLVVQLGTVGRLRDTRADLAATEQRVDELSAEVDELSDDLEDANQDLDQAAAARSNLAEKNQELRDSLDGCHDFFRTSAEAVAELGFFASPAEYQAALGAKGFNQLLACWGGKLPRL